MNHSPETVVVVGGGVAGLATALRLAPLPVTLVVAAPLGVEAATGWAQGGIAAALGADDRPDLHAIDTLTAGAGLSQPLVARRVAGAAPAAIDWLVGLGTPFDRNPNGSLALGLEAAHARRRIVHAAGDGTGRVVLETLTQAVRACPAIHVMEGWRAGELLADAHGRTAGVAVRDREGRAVTLAARAVVVATGGLGGLYGATTNPLGAVGSGLALAARAGAVLRDLEFVQFHPTAMAVGGDPERAASGGPAPMPLATEALRGEGARLFNARGERFMEDVPGRELAPRDVVARAIFAEIAAGQDVVLDARMKDIETRFPGVVALCRANGLDPARAPIPVRPAAHYHMGGIKVDGAGRSSVPGLWACGEVASTGLHGANRLASNSLLEALAYAEWIAADIAGEEASPGVARAPSPPRPRSPARAEIRALMDRQVGVVREAEGLEAAAKRLGALADRDGDDLSLVALAITEAALRRGESRGGHFRADHPVPAAIARHSETRLADPQAAQAVETRQVA
ncbi:L-aspartate oxidase [Ancylobacter dichloromethanicus]|uniref:L-aspartate oxidase n=1 Tax=Ancylobacter dichloromethanicus TaxID=518825 RepID=A0A9W6N1D4_9HYPH|nr:L-aspartate oxidase [Ancylobacter dichloromethanicus]MBS7552346.1 L-aspartate oxidase [Ancylobacter dichloromethanicus]GLK74083.1 L-aspartate oxidase [Ancylobacter dichloromethanicus]